MEIHLQSIPVILEPAASRMLYVYPDHDGTVFVRGRLTPEVGALLVQALAAARNAFTGG